MSMGVIGLEFDRSFEPLLRFLPIPIVLQVHNTQRCMSFSQCFVQLNGTFCGTFRPCHCIFCIHVTIGYCVCIGITVGQSSMCPRVGGSKLNSAVEMIDSDIQKTVVVPITPIIKTQPILFSSF